MRAIVVDRYQEVDELKVSDIPEPELMDTGIIIEVKAASANFPDALSAAGKYQLQLPVPFTLGAECVGIVRKVGSESVHDCKEGDKVICVCGFGAFAEKIYVGSEATVIPLPKGMSYVEGAAFSATYSTSYTALVHRGNLKPNEVLLVNAAAGGVGLAAVQIGRALGATVIGTVGSSGKVEVAKQAGCHHVIDLSQQSLIAEVKKLTDGRGADVVLDPVGGDIFDQSLKCTAWNGRVLVVGFANGRIPTVKTNYLLLKGVSIIGVNLAGMLASEPAKAKETFQGLSEMYEKGLLKPVLYSKIFKLDEVGQALKVLSSRQSYGKVVIAVDESIDLKAKL